MAETHIVTQQFDAETDTELSLQIGDRVIISDYDESKGWAYGSVGNRAGWLPTSHVKQENNNQSAAKNPTPPQVAQKSNNKIISMSIAKHIQGLGIAPGGPPATAPPILHPTNVEKRTMTSPSQPQQQHATSTFNILPHNSGAGSPRYITAPQSIPPPSRLGGVNRIGLINPTMPMSSPPRLASPSNRSQGVRAPINFQPTNPAQYNYNKRKSSLGDVLLPIDANLTVEPTPKTQYTRRSSLGNVEPARQYIFQFCVEAIHPYTTQSDNQLSFVAKEKLDIMETASSHEEWYRARNKAGQIGLVPKSYVKTKSQSSPVLAERLWYRPGITRKETINKMHSKQIECYVVRDSEAYPGCFTLSVKGPDQVRHVKITTVSNGYEIGDKKFRSLDAVVDFYRNSPIYIADNGAYKLFLSKPLT